MLLLAQYIENMRTYIQEGREKTTHIRIFTLTKILVYTEEYSI